MPRAEGGLDKGGNLGRDEFRPSTSTRYRVPTRPVPYWLVWLLARFDPAIRGVLGDWRVTALASADKARHDLGWTTRPLTETLLDTAAALIEHQIVTTARPL